MMNTTKICTNCKIEKDIHLFSRNKGMSDGHNFWCKDCSNKIQEEKRRKTTEFINNIKSLNKCSCCGISDIRVLHFHHIDTNNKDMSISNMTKCNKDKIISEIKKCTILCGNCHSIYHSYKDGDKEKIAIEKQFNEVILA